jgi:class 3 adenylate cyclase
MENKQKAQWVLYLGMAAALGLFNLMLAVFIRDSNYLLYTVSVLGIAWAMSSSGGGFGAAYEYLWPDSPRFEQAGWLISTFVGAFFNMVFFLKFANFRVHLPRIAIFLRICLLVFGLIMLFGLIGTLALPASAPILTTLHIFGPSVLFTMYIGLALSLLWLAWHGNRQAKFLCVAWLPVFFFISYWAVSIVREQPFNVALAMWASAFELVLMALALADLFNQEKKAKEQAQATVVKLLQHSEHELEEKVAVRTQELQQEQNRNKELLHNILPVDIATELSETGSAQPARHDPVTIIFTDFIGFTHTTSLMPANRMVDELNEIFAAFDDICDLYGIEKIKTIGDAYMAVAGMPKPCADHAQRCVRAALRMVDYIDQRNTQAAFKWTLRIGIHSGPVVAGVVGKRKFAFDIWGDTVNVAARMESAGEDGRVNVSAYTCQLIQSEFECQYRGKLDVKSIGAVDMYFVTEIPRS